MPDAGNGSVQLLEADPELARGLDPRRVREVSQRLFARSVEVPRGSWTPRRSLIGGSQPIGLLALMWCLAERWGRVVPGGVVVSLRLPHRTLAGMVGARRPSVTTALGQLMARGDIERRPDGGWLLHGDPPDPRSRPSRA